jgi:hypothetical protein
LVGSRFCSATGIFIASRSSLRKLIRIEIAATSPFSTKVIKPVSSETTTEIASEPSVTPIAARWRVPSSRETLGFFVSGRKTEAAAIRSFE